jgi:hypothetical protein
MNRFCDWGLAVLIARSQNLGQRLRQRMSPLCLERLTVW